MSSADVGRPLMLVTNVAAPYRVPVWAALARNFDLRVLVLASDEPGRHWGGNASTRPGALDLAARRIVWGEACLYWLSPGSIPRLRDGEVVVLGGWESPAYWQLLRCAKRAAAPTVAFYESTLASHHFRRGPIALMRRRFFQSVDSIVTVGGASAAAVDSFGVSPSRVHVGFNPVDGRRIREQTQALREPSTSPDHRFIYVGQLINRKNVYKLLDAFALISSPEDRLRVVGTGVTRPELERRAQELGCGERVTFAGSVEYGELPGVLAQADTLVLPSTEEVWGLVVNEALAAGLHVVVSDCAGVATSVADMPGVFTCPPSVAGIGAAMIKSREQWTGPIDDPEILVHGPEALAAVIGQAIEAAVQARSSRTPLA